MNFLRDLPRTGKIVVLAPETAARLAEQAPDHQDRVFTATWIEPNTAYVIDMDHYHAIDDDEIRVESLEDMRRRLWEVEG